MIVFFTYILQLRRRLMLNKKTHFTANFPAFYLLSQATKLLSTQHQKIAADSLRGRTLVVKLKCTNWHVLTLENTIHCDGRILISFVFPQFTSFHSVFHSFHGLMNSINWPASSIWVFIAQLGEHCSANAEATGSNPVEAPKNLFFFGLFSQLLKLRFTAMVAYSFHLYSRSSRHFIR